MQRVSSNFNLGVKGIDVRAMVDPAVPDLAVSAIQVNHNDEKDYNYYLRKGFWKSVSTPRGHAASLLYFLYVVVCLAAAALRS